jgi:DNA-binding SARP family transcriptional activator
VEIATAGTEFGLLGPMLVRCDGIAVPVPPGKQRVVLAALLRLWR